MKVVICRIAWLGVCTLVSAGNGPCMQLQRPFTACLLSVFVPSPYVALCLR